MLRREDSAAERRHPSSRSRGVEVCPEKAAQIPTSGKAGHISSRGMLSSRPSPKPTSRDTSRHLKGGAQSSDKGPTERRGQHQRGPADGHREELCGTSRDLGPTGARAEQTESALSVRKLADGGQESPGLTDAPAEQVLAPARGPQRSSQKLEIGGPNPSTTRKVPRSKRLGRRARRDDLGLVQIDFESNTPEAADQGREKVPHRRGRTGTER